MSSRYVQVKNLPCTFSSTSWLVALVKSSAHFVGATEPIWNLLRGNHGEVEDRPTGPNRPPDDGSAATHRPSPRPWPRSKASDPGLAPASRPRAPSPVGGST